MTSGSACVKIVMGLVHQIVFQKPDNNRKSHHVKHTYEINIKTDFLGKYIVSEDFVSWEGLNRKIKKVKAIVHVSGKFCRKFS